LEISREPIFATTRWSVVLQAGRHDSSPESSAALAELCRVYWRPLYADVRGMGFDVHSAQDLTQEFFGKLLEKKYVTVADRRRGKFRWFLLTALKCFLANEWDRTRAQKRGGGEKPLSLDAFSPEQRDRMEPTVPFPADQTYDRGWAFEILDRTRSLLRDEYASAGKTKRFECLEQFLPGEQPAVSCASAARALGTREDALRQETHRMKKRFGELLRQEVARTVAHPEEVDEEIRYLIDVVCRR
jgi:RNA polymerase sigma-70 factor (ECF subfamily)